jgi:threonine synthase
MALTEPAFQRCINPDCDSRFSVSETHIGCPRCGELLEIDYDWNRLPTPDSLREFESRWGAPE